MVAAAVIRNGRNRSKTFNLEEKFENLYVLEQDELPTQIQYPPQGPSAHTSSNRNPGDLLTQSVFDTDDMVNPTPV